MAMRAKLIPAIPPNGTGAVCPAAPFELAALDAAEEAAEAAEAGVETTIAEPEAAAEDEATADERELAAEEIPEIEAGPMVTPEAAEVNDTADEAAAPLIELKLAVTLTVSPAS